MKIHFISYGDDLYANSKKRIKEEAENFGMFDEICIYEPHKLTEEFKKTFSEILSLKRGGGYWIWKYDIILQELAKMNQNDILVYLDSGCTIAKTGIKRFNEYIEMLTNSSHNSIGFEINLYERSWTTKEIFNSFDSKIDNSCQIMGGCQIYKKNDKLLEMFKEIIDVLKKDPYLITDKYNLTQLPCFIYNRHDQSISSIVRKKYGTILLPYWEIEVGRIQPEMQKNYTFSALRLK